MKKTADQILHAMAETFLERNAVYKDNVSMVGELLSVLHPSGVTIDSAAQHELFHLWSLLIVKLSRFATSDLKHIDSIHDAAVYAAMIESVLHKYNDPAVLDESA